MPCISKMRPTAGGGGGLGRCTLWWDNHVAYRRAVCRRRDIGRGRGHACQSSIQEVGGRRRPIPKCRTSLKVSLPPPEVKFPWKFPETCFLSRGQISKRISRNLDLSQQLYSEIWLFAPPVSSRYTVNKNPDLYVPKSAVGRQLGRRETRNSRQYRLYSSGLYR